MAYCSYPDIVNYIDAVNLQAIVDDYGQGVGNTGPAISSSLLVNVCQLASNACDAHVASIYATPFATPPALIKQASIIFACEILYKRRMTPGEKNPFTSEADVWRDRLMKIGAGDLPLDQAFNRTVPPVVFSLKRSPMNTNIY